MAQLDVTLAVLRSAHRSTESLQMDPRLCLYDMAYPSLQFPCTRSPWPYTLNDFPLTTRHTRAQPIHSRVLRRTDTICTLPPSPYPHSHPSTYARTQEWITSHPSRTQAGYSSYSINHCTQRNRSFSTPHSRFPCGGYLTQSPQV